MIHFFNIATRSSSITLPLSGIGLVVILISTGIACGLISSKKVIYEIVMQKYKKYRKQYQKDQQTENSFDKFYKKKVYKIM